MDSQKDILKSLAIHMDEMEKSFSVTRIGLFGSFVHNKANAKSDIDIVTHLNEPTFDHYMDLKFYLEKLFGRSVDLVLADTIKPRLAPIVEQEAIYVQRL